MLQNHILNRLHELLSDVEATHKYIEILQNNAESMTGYCELHHIIPKSFDFSLACDPANIIAVPPELHFELHRLLVEATVGSKFLYVKALKAFTAFTMNSTRQERNLTAEQYGILRRACSESMKGNALGKGNKSRTGMKNSHITRQRISAANKGRKFGFLGKKHSKEVYKKAAEKRRGQCRSETTKEKQSLAAVQRWTPEAKLATSMQQKEATAKKFGFSSRDDMAMQVRSAKNDGKTLRVICSELNLPNSIVQAILYRDK